MNNCPKDSGELFEFFKSQGKILKFKKNQIVVHGDDNPTSVFRINSGHTRGYHILEDGNRSFIFILGPGDIFPAIAAETNIRHPIYHETITECSFYKVDKNQLLKFIQSNNSAALQLLSITTVYLHAMIGRAITCTYINHYHRLISNIILIVNLFNKNTDGQQSIDFSMSQQDFADSLGTTRETINRDFQKLKAKKILVAKNKIIHLDMEKLLQESSTF